MNKEEKNGKNESKQCRAEMLPGKRKDICNMKTKITFPFLKKEKKKLVYIIGIIFGAATLLTGGEYLNRQKMQQEIAEKIIRLHVIANSDSKEDQELKLQVRDAVGGEMQQLLSGIENRMECEAVLRQNREQITETAERVIAQAGYDYKVETFLKEVDFPVKSYGNYTFPAGAYEALEIVIGEGAGHNWWCVMYPNMCFSGSVYEVVDEDAKNSLKEVLSAEEYREVLESGDYQVQFKYLTFLNELSAGNEE